MDEGTRSAELTFKMGIALKEAMLRMAIAILKAIVRHIEWLKQHNIKPMWKERLDKMQVKAVRQTVALVQEQRDIAKDKYINFEKELDKFKLDKQYELENTYNVEINKAKKALEIVQNQKIEMTKDKNVDPNKLEEMNKLIATKQMEVDAALNNKRDFEYETNKELMDKNHTLQEYKRELDDVEYDLKVCNAKLNSLESNKNIETGRLRREYQDLNNKYFKDTEIEVAEAEKSMDNVKNQYETEVNKDANENIENIENAVNYNGKIVDDINKFQATEEKVKESIDKDAEHNYDSQEYYDNLENNIDEISQIYHDTEKDVNGLNENIDNISQMLEKDPAALKAYEEMKKNGELEVKMPQNQELEVARG